jgi:hypothetical protein
MLVERAQSPLDAQLRGRQWLDLKALGLLGPDAAAAGVVLRAFYETFGSGAAVDVSHQMLTELLEAIETNDRVTGAHQPRCSSSSASS